MGKKIIRLCWRTSSWTGDTIFASLPLSPARTKSSYLSRAYRIIRAGLKRRPIEVELQLRYSQMTVHPPIDKQMKYPPLSLTVIHAWERGNPEGRKPISWKLLTDLPVEDLEFCPRSGAKSRRHRRAAPERDDHYEPPCSIHRTEPNSNFTSHVVDVRQPLVRRRSCTITARISNAAVGGSGTAAGNTEPVAAVWPKCACQTP